MRFVERIEPAGEAETVCIQVAAADSLYVTDDFLVTHNTLNDSFVILDEAQNTTPEQMKMFLTRLGFNSKMVITGDITQIDLPRDQRSGLVVVREILRGGRRRRVRALRRRRRRAPPARAAHRRGLRRARRARRARAAPGRAAAAAAPERARRRGASARRRRARRRSRRSSASSASPWPRPASTTGHVAVEFVDADADRRAQRASYRGRAGPTDVLSFPVDGDGARRRPARARRHRHLPRAHRRTCARRSSTARCTSPAWTTRPTTGEMLALQAEILSW